MHTQIEVQDGKEVEQGSSICTSAPVYKFKQHPEALTPHFRNVNEYSISGDCIQLLENRSQRGVDSPGIL